MKNPNVLGSFLQNLSMMAALIVGTLVGAYYYGNHYNDGTQLENQISGTKGQIQEAENKKKETERLLAEEGQMKKEVGELAEKFKEVSSKLPINLKTQEIIDTINQLAKNSGCKVVTIKPGSTSVKELYDEIPVQVEMRGAFSNLVVFMYYLATLERVTYTTDISFVNAATAYDGNLRFNTSVISFRFRQPTAAPEPPPKPVAKPKGGKH
jgi:type IV pilus assembly protein PilO